MPKKLFVRGRNAHSSTAARNWKQKREERPTLLILLTAMRKLRKKQWNFATISELSIAHWSFSSGESENDWRFTTRRELKSRKITHKKNNKTKKFTRSQHFFTIYIFIMWDEISHCVWCLCVKSVRARVWSFVFLARRRKQKSGVKWTTRLIHEVSGGNGPHKKKKKVESELSID